MGLLASLLSDRELLNRVCAAWAYEICATDASGRVRAYIDGEGWRWAKWNGASDRMLVYRPKAGVWSWVECGHQYHCGVR